eukprot:7026021-Prymnesium_polylepis.1
MGHWGQLPPHLRDDRTLIGHLGRAHTHTATTTFGAPDGCRMVVCTPFSASRVAMGHSGQHLCT